jgi:hypothetical protein
MKNCLPFDGRTRVNAGHEIVSCVTHSKGFEFIREAICLLENQRAAGDFDETAPAASQIT